MNTRYAVVGRKENDRLVKAIERLVIGAAERRKRKPHAGEEYYGDGHEEEPEPDASLSHITRAIVTRNHYGCLVLNASRALFIDVDMGQPAPAPITTHGVAWDNAWQTTLDDLRTVLSNESDEGFRIYRTAAGFRILATTREFDPASAASSRLMDAVGADDDFVRLCRIQNSFRARLTPKPWRCGSRRPPNLFPRRSAEEKRRFTQWLSQYERACRGRATCQFLEHVGPGIAHPCIAPLVEFHDRQTKAFQALCLA